MKAKDGLKFLGIIILTIILCVIALTGNFLGINTGGKAADINTGIDIRGGVRAVLTIPEGVTPDAGDMDTINQIIRQRLDSLNMYDSNIIKEKDNTQLVVEIPWKQGEEEFDARKTIEDVIQVASLTFTDVPDDVELTDEGLPAKPGKTLVEGKYVVDSTAKYEANDGGWIVTLEFNSEGEKLFAEATKNNVGKQIAIFMDDKCVSAPKVNEAITGGNAIIEGISSSDEAQKLSALIRSGKLPYSLTISDLQTISPSLGENSLKVTVQAGILAFLLVALFMLIFYRLPGIIAVIALLTHTVLQLVLISWLGVTVTLPGIAGIILTIGMGIDADVIIFSRIKEELVAGKTLKGSIETGFKKAITAIIDSNITTLISAAVLYYFGTGPIKSFAITLALGVILSFITAIFFTRSMLYAVKDLNLLKHPALYGVSKKKKDEEVQA